MDKCITDDMISVKFGESTYDWERIDNLVARIYSTRNELIQDVSLKIGAICKTYGYSTVGDGGGGEYLVVANENPADDIHVMLANGLTAKLQYGIEINVRQLGIKAGSNSYKTQNASKLAYYIKNYPIAFKFFFPQGDYYFVSVNPDKGNRALAVNLCGESCAPQSEYQKTRILTEGENFLYDNSDSNSQCYFEVSDLDILSTGRTGIAFGSKNSSECSFRFNNVYIEEFDYGFYAPFYSTGGSGGKNITFFGCHYGCYIGDASHFFDIDGLNLNYNRVGLRMGVGGSPCRIKNVHIALGYYFSDKDKFTNFIGIHTKGGLEIDGLYCEDYIGATGQPEKTIVIDYEYWSYGVESLRIKNTPVQTPAAKGSKFMRFYQYAGEGREINPAATPTRYMTDILFFNNCQITRATPLKDIIEINPNEAQLGICVDGQNEYYGTFEILMNRPHYQIKAKNCIAGILIEPPNIITTVRAIQWTSASDVSSILVDSSKIINPTKLDNFFWPDTLRLSFGFNFVIKYIITGSGVTNGTYQLVRYDPYKTPNDIPVNIEQIIVTNGTIKTQGVIRILDTISRDAYMKLGFLNNSLAEADYSKLSLDLELIQLGPDRFI